MIDLIVVSFISSYPSSADSEIGTTKTTALRIQQPLSFNAQGAQIIPLTSIIPIIWPRRPMAKPFQIGRCYNRNITASCPSIKSAKGDDKIMLTAVAKVRVGITRNYTIRVNAEIASAPLISLAQPHFAQNTVSRFSCKGCTLLTIREKKQMTATDNTFIHIGSRKSGVSALLRNQFTRPAPPIPLGETAVWASAVSQTAKKAATIVS